MDNLYLSAVVRELASEVQGRSIARVSLTNLSLLIDLRLGSGRQLMASMDRTSPALYITSSIPEASATAQQSVNAFIALLRKNIFDATLTGVSKTPRDRIIQADFEKLKAGDNRIRTTLRLILAGRTSNAYLIDSEGNLIASMFEQPVYEPTAAAWLTTDAFDGSSLKSGLNESITEAQILDRFWGIDSIFGPQLKNEFLARRGARSPASAFASLIDDLFNSEPIPLVYSKSPLERIGKQLINPREDLLLSHIDLVQAQGMARYRFQSLSEAADEYYRARRKAAVLRADYTSLKQLLAREIARREAAIKAIESDRARFQDPDRQKRFGDLILANLANAKRLGSSITVLDYYDPGQREIQIEIPEGARLEDAAADYFARYQKARRALEAIESREKGVARSLKPLRDLLLLLEEEPTDQRIDEVRRATDETLGRAGANKTARGVRRARKSANYGRRFRSSDGFEILVGRNDRENDAITFRVARPHDIWLHAADYPGSHVILRNPSRETVSHRAIIEAAELAAFYSQAKRDGKAAVHYTQRKFVSKPPRARHGLVRLSSFKTTLVEPRCSAERVE